MVWTKRRDLLVGLLATAAAGRLRAAESDKAYRIAAINAVSPIAEIAEKASHPAYPVFFGELRRLGYIEGRNLTVLRYSAEGHSDRFDPIIREVVDAAPDLVFVPAGIRFVLGFKVATTTIPVVGVFGDPLAAGIVSSLARPGGNITGISLDAGLEIWGKRLEFLREAVPTVSRVGVLAAEYAWGSSLGEAIRRALHRNSMVQVGSPMQAFQGVDYENALRSFREARADAIVVHDGPENYGQRRLIADLIAKAGLPAVYGLREFVEVGGLFSYGAPSEEAYRRAADYVDLILKGTHPGDLPIYQGARFNLVINLKTARTLKLSLPATLLARADEVIE